NLQEALNEDAATENITSIEREINTAREPARSILQSIAAERYWNYLQQNRWNLFNRTQTTGNPGDDITRWGIADFHKKITALYLASIKNENLLQSQKVETFDPIILKGNVRNLRPTLFDLLTNRAIEFFTTEEGFAGAGMPRSSQPQNRFE